MLKVEVNDGIQRVEFTGSLIDALAEVTAIIASLYGAFTTDGSGEADVFKNAFQEYIADNTSKVWNPGKLSSDGIKSVAIHLPNGFSDKEG